MDLRKLRLVLETALVVAVAFGLVRQGFTAEPLLRIGNTAKARYIIDTKYPLSRDEATDLIKSYNGKFQHNFPRWSVMSADLEEGKVPNLFQDHRVLSIRKAVKFTATQDTLDWGVDRIDAEIVWGGADGSKDVVPGRNAGDGIKVAIIDTGIDYNHPDLAPNYEYGYDFVNDDEDPMDDNGHGTHCAGIVAAADNGEGVIGVAPKARLYAVKVLDSSGSGWEDDIAAGIRWCMDNGIQIISMSLGSNSDSVLVRNACDDAYNAGILLVAAAGNDYRAWGSRWEWDTVDYPARYDSVIAVGAIDDTDTKATWSSTGPDLELAAPGVVIESTYLGGDYVTMSGTSMACPHVAGTAALVWYGEPGLTQEQVRDRLRDTAEDLGDSGKDNWYGYGLVDAEAAALAEDVTPPTVTGTSPADEATDVPVTTPIEVTFSEPMDEVSAQSAFSISIDDQSVSGSFSWRGNTMIFTPGETLSYETTYTVTIAATAEDLAENTLTAAYIWSFTTEAADVTPPRVTGTSPANGATNVPVTTTIEVTFSEPMDKTSVEEYAFFIIPSVNGSFSWSGNTMIFRPEGTLSYGTSYYCEVGMTAKDLAGNPLDSLYSWRFTTEVQPQGDEYDMYVWSIEFSTLRIWRWVYLYVYIEIRRDSNANGKADPEDEPVSGAGVTTTLTREQGGEWIGTGATTDSNGVAIYQLSRAKTGTYVAEVTNLTHNLYTWNPELDKENPSASYNLSGGRSSGRSGPLSPLHNR